MGKPRLKLAANGGLVVLNQSYEAAGQGRRAKAWVAPASGPNRSLGYGLQTLRNRSRGAYRNNAWVYRAVESRASNEVGVGVSMRSAALDKAYREATTALWLQSRSELDPEGLLNFGGIQAQATRTRLIAGEAFIRRRRRRTDSGLVVPMQVQVLDPEFVPLGYRISVTLYHLHYFPALLGSASNRGRTPDFLDRANASVMLDWARPRSSPNRSV